MRDNENDSLALANTILLVQTRLQFAATWLRIFLSSRDHVRDFKDKNGGKDQFAGVV
jgi:hypothetical protein